MALAGVAAPVASAAGALGPNDGFDCVSRKHEVMRYLSMPPGSRTADEAMQRTQMSEWLRIPPSSRMIADLEGIDEPRNGTVRLRALPGALAGSAEYLVFLEGRGIMRVSVEGSNHVLFHGYNVAGWTICAGIVTRVSPPDGEA